METQNGFNVSYYSTLVNNQQNLPWKPSGYSWVKNAVVIFPSLKFRLPQMSLSKEMLCSSPRITYESNALSMVSSADCLSLPYVTNFEKQNRKWLLICTWWHLMSVSDRNCKWENRSNKWWKKSNPRTLNYITHFKDVCIICVLYICKILMLV